MSPFACSVVIPSHNRRGALEILLRALAAQSLPSGSFEVAVVLDGSGDGSDDLLRSWAENGPLALRWAYQPRAGQAAARNRGVAMTTAPVVLFLDDDVVPEPDLLMRHLGHHGRGRRVAVLGDCPVVRTRPRSLYQLGLWAWWEDTYHHRGLSGRQSTYRDFCAGNVSLRREDFLAAGGFDVSFRGYGGEDFELGYRLLRSGVGFIADRRARARHHHDVTLARVLTATREEGAADVLLGQRHPELRSGLRLMWPPRLRDYRPALLAFRAPALGRLAAWSCRHRLPLYERLRRRNRWLNRFEFARSFAYWSGVADALGSVEALAAFRRGAPPPPVLEIDITFGIPDPLPSLWVHGPSRVVVTVAGARLGEVALPGPLQEPVRERLAREISNQLWLPLVGRLGVIHPRRPRGMFPGAEPVASDAEDRSVGFGA